MSTFGPAASGKSPLLFQVLKKGISVPAFEEIFCVYQYFQTVSAEMQKQERNIEFTGSLEFDFIENLLNDGPNYLLISDDSRDEISR